MKPDHYFLTGALSLVLFCICGILSVKGGIGLLLLCIFLYFLFAAGILAGALFVLPSFLKIERIGSEWIVIAPFAVMLFLSRIFLGWNVFAPFCIAAFLALTYSIARKNENLSVLQKLILCGFGAICSISFIAVSVIGGVLL